MLLQGCAALIRLKVLNLRAATPCFTAAYRFAPHTEANHLATPMTAASAVNLQISRPEDAVPTYAYAAGAGAAAAAHTAAAAAAIDAAQSSFWSRYSNPGLKAASASGSPCGCHAARPLPTTTIAMSPLRLPLLPLSRNCRRRRPQGGLTPAHWAGR